MKKILSLTVCVLLLVASLSLSASAEGKGRVALIWEEAELSRGDLFSAVMECNKNPGFSSLLVNVVFDPQVLEVYSVEDLGLFPGFSYDPADENGKLVLRWKAENTGDSVASVGHPLKLVFRVKEDARLVDTDVQVQIDERFFDAQAPDGSAIPFETEGFTVPLQCLHVHQKTEILTAATFDAAGAGKRICLDCGLEEEISVLPTITSADGKTVGEVMPGTYREEEEKGIRTDYLYGGADYAAAQALFGDSIVRVFKVSFTKGDIVFSPSGESPVHLTVDFYLPDAFSLYVIGDGNGEKVDADFSDGILTFDHTSKVFVLVSGETEPPEITTDAPPSTPAEETVSSSVPGEEEDRGEVVLLVGAAAAVVLFGGAALYLLRRPRGL